MLGLDEKKSNTNIFFDHKFFSFLLSVQLVTPVLSLQSGRVHSHLFCSRMMSRHVSTFRTSAITTADVAKKRSPGNVRTYRMLRMSDAFWTTSTARLMYFSFLLTAGNNHTQNHSSRWNHGYNDLFLYCG